MPKIWNVNVNDGLEHLLLKPDDKDDIDLSVSPDDRVKVAQLLLKVAKRSHSRC